MIFKYTDKQRDIVAVLTQCKIHLEYDQACLAEWINFVFLYEQGFWGTTLTNFSQVELFWGNGKQVLVKKNYPKYLKFMDKQFWEFIQGDTNLNHNSLLIFHAKLIVGGSNSKYSEYRKKQVEVTGSIDKFPTQIEISALMEEFFRFCLFPTNNILEFVCQIHYQLVKIHPFVDYNGRLARVLMNMFLMRYDYLPIIIPYKIKKTVYQKSLPGDNFYKFYGVILDIIYQNYQMMYKIIASAKSGHDV